MTKEIYWQEHGLADGTHVLLLHDLGQSGAVWRPFLERSHGLRASVPDLPGHGGSRHVLWRSLSRTAGRLAAELAGVRAPIPAIGQGLGARVALELMSTQRCRVHRVLLAGLDPAPGQPGQLLDWLGRLLTPMARTRDLIRTERQAARWFEPGKGSDLARYLSTSRRALSRAGQSLVTPVALSATAGARTVCILVGEKEPMAMRRNVAALAQASPAVMAYLVPDEGSGWLQAANDVSTRLVASWLAGDDLGQSLAAVRPG